MTTQSHVQSTLDIHDILAIQALAPLSSSYLPWTISAMRPSGLVAVLNEILVNRRRCVVELGSGISTCYIGRLLRQHGGRLTTVEHDERWADWLEDFLAGEQLTDVVSIVRAPLVSISPGWPGEETTWYERSRLTDALDGQHIDLLLIDGPPAYRAGREHSRYPALPILAPMFAEDHAIILDDIDRTGEQEIVDVWERDFGITFQLRPVNGGIGISHSRVALDV